MKKYEFLEHTADTKLVAYGKDIEEAFANAALGITSIITDVNKIKPVIEKKVKKESASKESLLYDFLEELLFLLDAETFLLNRVEKIKIKKEKDRYKLEATLWGDKAKNYETHGTVKAITYHQMLIKEEKNKVTLQVVPDL